MEQNILAISGKPGLYRLLSRGRNTLVVESVDAAKKRHSVGVRDRITSINDISIYTDDEDVPLLTVFKNMFEKEGGKAVAVDAKKASKDELAEYLGSVLPNFDRDRVYPNDMKKIILWYNILVENGYTDFELPKEDEEPAEETAAPEA